MSASPGRSLKKQPAVARGQSRGRIRADGFIDHGHTERKELFLTLRVLAVFLAVMAVILFVALYMKQWGME